MHQKNLFEEVDFNPFSAIDIERVVSPIDPQKEIWVSCILGGEDANRSYNESVTVKFEGKMDSDTLLTAMEEVIKRHEALRTTFSSDGKSIFIHEGLKPEFLLEDLSGYSMKIIDDHIQSYLIQNALIPFDLLNGPLFRVALFKISEAEHHLVFTAHHVICDGWSFGVIMRELSELYTADIKGIPPHLPIPYDFTQYAEDSRIFTSTQAYAEIEKYWLNQYQTIPPLLELPHDWPVPEIRTFESSRIDFELDSATVKAVKNLGLKANSSFISTLIVAFETYFYKKSGQDDIVIGLPTSGQASTGNFELVGHCVNVLPIRSNPKSPLSFIEYLKERSLALSNDYDHQQLTFGSLIKKLNIKRDVSRVPLIPFVLNIDMGLDTQLKFEGLSYQLENNPRKFETFEIFLNIVGESGGPLKFQWSYNTQMFKEETMRKMMDDLTGVLRQVTDLPTIRIGDITLRSNHILEQIAIWNDTQADFPLKSRFTEFISETAAKNPRKSAIEFADRAITYAELEETSNNIAAYLAGRSLGREDIIGVHMQRSPEMVMLLLGITKAGAAYLPLDPEYPRDRIEYMLRDSKAKLLIANMGLETNFGAQAEEITAEEIWGQLKPGAEMPPQAGSNGGDLAYVLYTSGSTGNPKGVQIEHHNLVNFLLSMQIAPGIHSDDRLLAITTISFDIAGLELFLPLVSGATLVLADTQTAKDGRLLLKWIEEKNITFMQATPSTWRMLLNSGWDNPLSLKALCGGEALSMDLAEKLLEKCNSVWNVYGPTETTIWSTIKKLKIGEINITIGRPIHNTQIYILDDERNLVAPGRIGEIYIGGEGVARGYLNRKDLTEGRFLEDPFKENMQGALMYRTGDLGKFQENGEIICLGRVDHQVKIRGHRIELGEIEHSIGKIYRVKEAVVMAREDIPGNQRLAAYLILQGKVGFESAQEPTKEQVQGWKAEVQKSLPPYMIPNDWVVLERFPLTSNNKVDRKQLPKPVTLSADEGMNEQLPSTKGQKLVADIWGKILGVNNIRLKDDFFDLGGHSLLAVEVMTQLERETRKRLPLNTLFRYPNLEEFAELFEEEKTPDIKEESWSCLVPIKPSGNKPPLYLIHGAGSYVGTFFVLAKRVDPDQPLYGLQARGLNGFDKPFTTLEEMASHYIEEIIKHNPDGPYYIGGQSFGGYVAYEMAKQMKQMNKEVEKLLLFDIDAYQSETKLSRWQKLGKKITDELQKRYMDIKLLLNHRETFMTQKNSSLERKKLKLSGIFNGTPTNPDVEIAHVIEKIRKINHYAMDNYLMSPYDGDIYLFKAKIPIFYIREKQYYGWRPYVNNIQVVEVDGDHNSMFEEPLVEELGKKVQTVLDC